MLILVLICTKNLWYHGMPNDKFVDFGFVVFKILSSVYSEIDSFTLLDICSFFSWLNTLLRTFSTGRRDTLYSLISEMITHWKPVLKPCSSKWEVFPPSNLWSFNLKVQLGVFRPPSYWNVEENLLKSNYSSGVLENFFSSI